MIIASCANETCIGKTCSEHFGEPYVSCPSLSTSFLCTVHWYSSTKSHSSLYSVTFKEVCHHLPSMSTHSEYRDSFHSAIFSRQFCQFNHSLYLYIFCSFLNSLGLIARNFLMHIFFVFTIFDIVIGLQFLLNRNYQHCHVSFF